MSLRLLRAARPTRPIPPLPPTSAPRLARCQSSAPTAPRALRPAPPSGPRATLRPSSYIPPARPTPSPFRLPRPPSHPVPHADGSQDRPAHFERRAPYRAPDPYSFKPEFAALPLGKRLASLRALGSQQYDAERGRERGVRLARKKDGRKERAAVAGLYRQWWMENRAQIEGEAALPPLDDLRNRKWTSQELDRLKAFALTLREKRGDGWEHPAIQFVRRELKKERKKERFLKRVESGKRGPKEAKKKAKAEQMRAATKAKLAHEEAQGIVRVNKVPLPGCKPNGKKMAGKRAKLLRRVWRLTDNVRQARIRGDFSAEKRAEQALERARAQAAEKGTESKVDEALETVKASAIQKAKEQLAAKALKQLREKLKAERKPVEKAREKAAEETMVAPE
ncbi:hypothetical protein CALCODRAFT_479079 [Calocera cornea HHB12733]|uniref:Uncharacterized protein n=1 Tax=Calocera cornea HHB12733 TaxID=1353952 RepID=A0A165JZW0_9BASI|nr:hypothetical protein CALCODRAFT_479079 [Calocera cornea HHB12733]